MVVVFAWNLIVSISSDLFPTPFDGAKIVVNKALSNHFQTSHNYTIGAGVTPSGYRFGATYIGTRQMSPSEAYPIFFGEIDPSGNLNSRIIHLIGDRLKLQFAAQIQNSKCVATHLNTDYLGSNYTASLALGNLDPVANSGVAVTSYIHNVTPNVALGGEVVAQYGSATFNSVVSVAARYTSPSDYILSGTLNQRGLQLCYYQKKNEHVQVGVQVETNLTEPDSTASFGYQIDMPKSNFTFKGLFRCFRCCFQILISFSIER